MIEPSYYAVIPANVRYDNRLKANEKLLYGEITALAQSSGFCFATNKYFADLYDVTNTSISLWIKSLIDCGYIKSHIEYREGTKEILKRYLSLVIHPPQIILNTPMQEKLKDNNTSSNNTSLTDDTSLFRDVDISLPVQILNYLNEKKGGRGFDVSSKGNQSHIKARIKEKKYSLDDFKKVIDAGVIKWLDDAKMKAYIRPETLFGSRFNQYLIEADDVIAAAHSAGSENFVHSTATIESLKND
jgi:uncharacterized phage protein (TIGR02220 family)